MLLNAAQRTGLFKFAIYGRGGVGKTHLGCTAPKPLIILTERQGFETVRSAAARIGIPMPPVFWVRDIGQVQAIVGHLRMKTAKPIEAMVRDPAVISDAELEEHGVTRDELVKAIPYARPETIVIDMLGEVAEWIGREVDKAGGMEVVKGIETRKLQAWAPIQRRIEGLIRTFRDMPYHVVFLCHDRIVGGKGDEDLDGSQVWPKLPGRELHKSLLQSVNAMGRMRIFERDVERDGKIVQEYRRAVEFVTSDAVLTKHASPLRDREPPNVSKWIEAMVNETRSTSEVEELASDAGIDEQQAKQAAQSAEGETKKRRSKKQEVEA